MKKILNVAAVSGLIAASVVLAAGMAQPPAAPGGGDGQPPARGPGGGQPGGPGGGGGRGGQRGGQVPGIGPSMNGMERSIDALKASIGDAAKKDENLRLLGEAQRFCASAKNAKPTDAINAAKDDAAKAKVATDYRKSLIEVMKALIEAEVATLDGKTAEAKTAYDKVVTLRDKGHKEFMPGENGKTGDSPVPPMLPPGGAR